MSSPAMSTNPVYKSHQTDPMPRVAHTHADAASTVTVKGNYFPGVCAVVSLPGQTVESLSRHVSMA